MNPEVQIALMQMIGSVLALFVIIRDCRVMITRYADLTFDNRVSRVVSIILSAIFFAGFVVGFINRYDVVIAYIGQL